VKFDVDELPESVFLRLDSCSLLEVAAGSGSVDVFKFLTLFQNAKATRDTFRSALARGDPEMVRLVWDSLPDSAKVARCSFLETAGDFHRVECVTWLFDRASAGVRERFFLFLLRAHLADSLVAILESGYRPWSEGVRGAVSHWHPASGIVFGPIPPPADLIPPNSRFGRFAGSLRSSICFYMVGTCWGLTAATMAPALRPSLQRQSTNVEPWRCLRL
jgi:hypothetical protein